MKKLITTFALSLLLQSLSAQTGLMPVQENNKYGYKNSNSNGYGAFIIPPKYEDAHYFIEGLAAVMYDGKWGFIDKNGSMKISAKYCEVNDFYEGMAKACTEAKEGSATYCMCGFINKTGATVVPMKYYNLGGFNEAGLCNVCLKDKQGHIKWGFINKTGALVIPCKYDSLGTSSDNGYMEVVVNGKVGFVNKKGVEVIAPKYENDLGNGVFSFHQGRAIVKLNGKKGMINEAGKEIIPCKYDEMDVFREGLASVAINNKWGFINETGAEVIALQYARVSPFLSEQTVVWETNGEEWSIDKTGNKIRLVYKPAPIVDSTTFFGIVDGLKPPSISLGSAASAELSVSVIANGKTYSYKRGFVDLQQCHLQKDDKITITVYMSKKGQLFLSTTGLKIEDFTYNDKGNNGRGRAENKGRGRGRVR